ncbi:MAG: DUF1800 family protein [Verrucomicrobiota bacterium]
MLLLMAPPCRAIIDLDNDGLDDIWEAFYGAGALTEGADEDQDGRSNREECVAGTNPFDSNDVHRASIERLCGELHLSSQTEAGKRYTLLLKSTLGQANWISSGLSFTGSGSNLVLRLDESGNVSVTGGATSEIWTDTTGGNIASLKATPGYPNQPHGTETLPRLKRPANQADNFGGRIRGYLIPPETGDYTFYIASRNQGELHLSPNSDTNNLVRIARCTNGTTQEEEFTRTAAQRSTPIAFTRGEKYYFEVRHKHAGQEDHLTVAWTGPGIDPNTPRVIEGPYLAPWIPETVPSTSGYRYLRLSVEDLDSDADGLSDWAEHLMFNFMPQDAQSTTAGGDDLSTITAMLQATGSVLSVTLKDDNAYEIGNSAARNVARFQVNRTGGLDGFTVPITLSASTDPAHGHPEASDYRAEDLEGNPVSTQVDMPFGATSVQVVIDPVPDTIHEYPESLVLTLQPDPAYGLATNYTDAIRINDATVKAETETLFVGLHVPEGSANTVGFGVATLILNGNNTIGRVNNSFSALTSRQTNTHIHKSQLAPDQLTLLSGPPVEEVLTSDGQAPLLGQLVDYAWAIHAPGAYDVQDIIDSLYGQNGATPLYINVHTENYGSGEIWALFAEQEGSTELEIPADPPPLSAESGSNLVYDVHRFLTQATFGPTSNEVAELVNEIETTHGGDRIAGYEAWMDAQFALEQSRLLDYTLAADLQEWELRQFFTWPTNFWTGTGPPPEGPTVPAEWPSYDNDIEAFDSLDPATWRMPSGSYPISGTHIQNEDNFTPRLGEPNYLNRRRAMWTIMVNAKDQLRQRLAFAWSEIMVVSTEHTMVRNNHYGAARYYDQLGENADDRFRELLEDVTYSPIMGKYLSSLFNQKAILDPGTGDVLVSPDENYAREIMQLFSIGLLQRHLDGTIVLDGTGLPTATYDNDDITELSRIFTGLSFSLYSNSNDRWHTPSQNTLFNRNNGNKYYGARYEYPMKMFGDYHDPDPKTILDNRVIDNTGIADLTERATADVVDALDALAGHASAPAFISRLLIQRLVTSNPSRGYLYRVAKVFDDNGSGQRGDLKAVTKAILLDYEARELAFTRQDTYGKAKEPLIRYIALLRASGAGSQLPVSDLAGYGHPASQQNTLAPGASRYRYADTTTALSQSPLRAPTVFNWFLPDYQPGGEIAQAGLYAPEFQLANENSVVRSVNYFWTISNGNAGQSVNSFIDADPLADNIRIDREPWINLYGTFTGSEAEKDAQLVDALDAVVTAGNLKRTYAGAAAPNPRSMIIDMLTTLSSSAAETKYVNALYLISTTPEYIIQK